MAPGSGFQALGHRQYGDSERKINLRKPSSLHSQQKGDKLNARL